MGAGTRTWAQHNAVLQPDGTVTIFDNGGGLPFVHPQSRGIRERLDMRNMTATLIQEYDHLPRLSVIVEGGLQLLSDGNAFIGWGAAPYMSEYGPSGRQIFDAHFDDPIASYRALRFDWTGQPATRPALAAAARGRDATEVYASWNGATEVASWRVLAGSNPQGLRLVASTTRLGFETAALVHRADRWFAVQAVSANGRVLASSRAVTATGKR